MWLCFVLCFPVLQCEMGREMFVKLLNCGQAQINGMTLDVMITLLRFMFTCVILLSLTVFLYLNYSAHSCECSFFLTSSVIVADSDHCKQGTVLLLQFQSSQESWMQLKLLLHCLLWANFYAAFCVLPDFETLHGCNIMFLWCAVICGYGTLAQYLVDSKKKKNIAKAALTTPCFWWRGTLLLSSQQVYIEFMTSIECASDFNFSHVGGI